MTLRVVVMPRCGPAEPASLRIPVSLADQPRLPVWALATVLLAHVSAFDRFDEMSSSLVNSNSTECRPLLAIYIGRSLWL
jgi:hypothetical protein